MQHQFLDEAGQQAAVATPPMRLTSLSPAASRGAPGSVGSPTAAMASVMPVATRVRAVVQALGTVPGVTTVAPWPLS
jgi:hypothetical protein